MSASMARPRRLAVDLRNCSAGGIGTYVTNMLPHLLALLEPEQLIALVTDTDRPDDRLLASADVHAAPRPFTLGEQLRVPTLLRKLGVDTAWFPHVSVPARKPVPQVVVTVHDLLYVDAGPVAGGWAKRAFGRMYLRSAVRIADRLVTPSRFSADRLVRTLGVDAGRVVVIPHGIDHVLGNRPAESSIRPDRPYFVYVGNFKRHKGIGVLLDAFGRLDADVGLVLVGFRPDQRTLDSAAIARAIGDRRVQLLPVQSQPELVALISGAVALVQPSLYEGFGLTAAEAIALGTHVIASDLPAIREATASNARFFPPGDASRLAAHMRTVLSEPAPAPQRPPVLRTWAEAAADFVQACFGDGSPSPQATAAAHRGLSA